MDQTNNPLILRGQRVYAFLSKLNNSKKPAFPHSIRRTDNQYRLFKNNVQDLRDFLSETLGIPYIMILLDEQDIITQARIRNIISPYHQYEQVDILSVDLPHNIVRKRVNYEKNLGIIQFLSSEEQKMLWEQRVEGSIWDEESGPLITTFILGILKFITPVFHEEKIVFFEETGRVMIQGVYLEKPLKLKTRTYKVFKILWDNHDKRVSNEDIRKFITKQSIEKSDSDYVSDIIIRLPDELRILIMPADKGYILDTSLI